ncbi:hypothetical protein Tco_1264432 [Tanacetum coccineum]
MLKVSPWKGLVRFGKQGDLIPRYVGPFKALDKVGAVAYKLELPQEFSRVHHTFHVSNLKKCYADEPLVVPLDGLHIDDKLHFIGEPIEIMDREVKRLKQSRIPTFKVRWNSRRGPEFTWEQDVSEEFRSDREIAIEFAIELMDKKISTLSKRQTKNKRKLDNNNQAQQQPPKKQGMSVAYTVGSGERKEYAGTLPLCNKCANWHYRSDCPELKKQNHGNQAGGTGARGMVLAKVGAIAYKLELPQELSKVHHTFYVSNLKKCYADEPLAVPLDGLHIDLTSFHLSGNP